MAYWAVILGLYVSLAVGASLVPPAWLHMPALFAHLGSVIVGLGAAVVLEFTGLLWIADRRSLGDLRMNERLISIVAWIGILGLLASGAFLHPNLSDPKTIVKMLAVLLVAMNGVAMTRLTDELGRLPAQVPFRSIPRSLKVWCVWSAVVSQTGWWTAVILGMLNTASH
ncbi:hypothetical protein [Microbacterium sp. cf046]|uniref:hypothetical protein n=1 Tax=Microbacterium sp. cf046 TaxID=1761803 RepID=UPI000B84F5C9|nr:hypothetical protein [Microbacterium sp. cf046]